MEEGKLCSYHVKERSIPEAYYEAMKILLGAEDQRTQYDRKKRDGEFIDPAGKDAAMMIEVIEPFAQPRYPILSNHFRGEYLAEIMGVKDHLVPDYDEIAEIIDRGEEPREWPYTYSQRIRAYPSRRGPRNQLEIMINRLAENIDTRRAFAYTGLDVDMDIPSDMPCLRKVHLRAREVEDYVVLNMITDWRSRDLYKAWGDNMVMITYLQQRLAHDLSQKLGKPVKIGSYIESNSSIHIYGQDMGMNAAGKFLDNFPTKKSFVDAAWTSEKARDYQIIPELNDLRGEKAAQFKLGPKQIALIDQMIEEFKTGRFVA